MAVGGPGARGGMVAASYERRRFGAHSAMVSVAAQRRCPERVFVPPRFDVYRAISQQIRANFARYALLILETDLTASAGVLYNKFPRRAGVRPSQTGGSFVIPRKWGQRAGLAEPEPCHSRAGIGNIVQESLVRARLLQRERIQVKPVGTVRNTCSS